MEQASAASNACCWSFPDPYLQWVLGLRFRNMNKVGRSDERQSQKFYDTNIFYPSVRSG